NEAGAVRIISTPIEHSAVRDTVARLEQEHGATVDLLPVGRDGHISELSALDTPAAVAAAMWANNETGAIMPVAGIVGRAAAGVWSVPCGGVARRWLALPVGPLR